MLTLLAALLSALLVGIDLGRIVQGYLPTVGGIVLTFVGIAAMTLSAVWHWQECR